MDRRSRLVASGVLVLAAVGGGAGVVLANSSDEARLTGSTMDRAVEAALAETGGGTVLETEVGDDGAAYGVEIRLADGRVVEVALDADFVVIGSEADDDGSGDDGSGDADGATED